MNQGQHDAEEFMESVPEMREAVEAGGDWSETRDFDPGNDRFISGPDANPSEQWELHSREYGYQVRGGRVVFGAHVWTGDMEYQWISYGELASTPAKAARRINEATDEKHMRRYLGHVKQYNSDPAGLFMTPDDGNYRALAQQELDRRNQ